MKSQHVFCSLFSRSLIQRSFTNVWKLRRVTLRSARASRLIFPNTSSASSAFTEILWKVQHQLPTLILLFFPLHCLFWYFRIVFFQFQLHYIFVLNEFDGLLPWLLEHGLIIQRYLLSSNVHLYTKLVGIHCFLNAGKPTKKKRLSPFPLPVEELRSLPFCFISWRVLFDTRNWEALSPRCLASVAFCMMRRKYCCCTLFRRCKKTTTTQTFMSIYSPIHRS